MAQVPYSMAYSSSKFRYTPLPPDNATRHAFRLLELLPDSETSAIIRCRLQQASIGLKTSYEALSYCWGDASSTGSILCNGAWLDVTTSLLSALRRLRDPTRIRMLWVDAICINQSPGAINERSQQVQLMRHIYENARRVVVWLGDAHDDSDLAMDLINQLIRAKPKLDEIGPVPFFEDKHLQAAGLPSVLSDKPWLSLRGFFRRPWFHRIWVVQEVAVAASAIVMCGAVEMPWEDLIHGVEIGLSSGVLTSKRAVDPGTVDFLNLANAARLDYHKSPLLSKNYSAYNFEGILNYLLWFRRRAATDPRDKVFALYGLTSSQANEMGLAADYGMNVQDAYYQVTVGIMTTLHNLDVLSVPRTATGLTSPMPSWVADWSNPENRTVSLVGQTRHRYASSKETRASPKFSSDRRILILEGEIIDRISLVAPTLEHDHSEPAPLYGWSTALQQFARNVDNLARNQNVLIEWERLAIETGPDRYVTGELNTTAFEQTLVANLPPSENMKAHYTDWRSNEAPRSFLKQLSFDKHPWIFKLGVLAQVGADVTTASNPQTKQYTTMAYGRRLARTGKGYLALVPPQTEFGDWIALCKGGQTPLVIRASSTETWTLLGDSYVHGIMNGEAFNEERCRDIHIV